MWGAIAALAGSAAGSLLKSASKPGVPKIPKLDLATEQNNAIAANKAALPAAQELATSTNQFNLDEWLKSIKFAFPEYETARDLVTKNALSMARGEIPIQDQNLLAIKDASKAFSGGYSGSGMHGALTARDLGTTTLQVMQQGQNALQSWLSTIKTPGQFDITSMFITPGQKYQTDNEQNMQQFQRKYAANVNDANYSWTSRIGDALSGMTGMTGMSGLFGAGGKTSA